MRTLEKVPIEALYKDLQQTVKELKVNKGQNESYIEELEAENKKLKASVYGNKFKMTPELRHQIFEYKQSEIHQNMVIQLKQLEESIKLKDKRIESLLTLTKRLSNGRY